MSFIAIYSEDTDTIQKLCACVSVKKRENFLQLNTDKSKFLIFSSRNLLSKSETVSFDGAGDILEMSSSVRNLAIIFDQSLSMNQHVCLISVKYASMICEISRIYAST